MKKLSLLLGLIGLGSVIYGLFQPIFNQFFGWEEIPNEQFHQRFEGIRDVRFDTEIKYSEAIIDSIQSVSKAPSISIAAMLNGEMVWNYAVGYQDISNKIAADTTTQYRIGSTSKALTSLGLAKMIELEKIHPDSSIQFYTDKFTNKPPISIRQLASHQSGIRNYGWCPCFPVWEYFRNKQFTSIEESVEEFESDKLLFIPGNGFSYSSFNFTALSLAMDNVFEQGYLVFMSKEVFKVLGMKGTHPDWKDQDVSSKATQYEINDNLYRKATTVNLSNKWAGGGFVSTPSDLVRAGSVLIDSSFISNETINLITSPQRLSDRSINEQNYAMGWRHDFSKRYFNGERDVEVIHHGGMAVGGLALLVVYPEYDLVIAITLNKGEARGNFRLFDYIIPIAELFILKLTGSDMM